MINLGAPKLLIKHFKTSMYEHLEESGMILHLLTQHVIKGMGQLHDNHRRSFVSSTGCTFIDN